MPSIRKRIGYLPSSNIQEIIKNIAIREKLSQSKVVGILVEEALIARGFLNYQNTNDLISISKYEKETNYKNTSFKYSDLDELISDKGIIYNTRKHNYKPNQYSSEKIESDNEKLFEQFKQFIQFKRLIKD
tara:strand:- start:35 stop:427 length:393 start_codon:yes stop_codon:yes gene_type:complete